MPSKGMALALVILVGSVGRFGTGPAGVETDAGLEFSQSGMLGRAQVRGDRGTGRVYYESTMMGRPPEKWDRRPSDEEWERFWTAMDGLGVWRWKKDYGTAFLLDCGSWRVALKYGAKSLVSGGCSAFPERAEWDGFVAAVAALRGGPEVAGSQALVLVKTLKESQDWNARIRTAVAIGKLGPGATTAVSALVESLGWPTPAEARPTEGQDLGEAAVRALVSIGDGAVPDLVRALKDDSPVRRRLAAEALGGIALHRPPTSAISALTEALHDASARQAAARALARIDSRHGPVVAPIFIEGLRDPVVEIAKYSASALEEIGAVTPAVVPALVRALDDRRIRHSVLAALHRIGPDAAAAVPALVTALKDDNEGVRQGAALALRRIGEGAKDAVPALIDALSHDPNGGVRAGAAEALGAIGAPAIVAIPALVDALRHGNAGYSVAQRAAGALARIGAPAVPALTAALKWERLGPTTRMADKGYQGPIYSDIENLRVGAVEALLRMEPRAESAIPALIDALKDQHPRVREVAAHALTQIRRP